MKKVLSVACILFITNASFSQGSVSDSLKKHYFNTYEQALKYKDIELAINSLNNVIAEMPANQALVFKDTLSMLYFNKKEYLSSLLLAQEVYKAIPSNTNTLARMGDCYQAGGNYKNAAEVFEIVAPALNSPFYYYQLGVCQYSLKKPTECLASADKALSDTSSNHIPVIFVLSNGSEQQVPVSAAALNMKAVVMMSNKNFTQAKQLLENALKIFPDFQGAKQNVITCDSNIKGIKPTANTKPKG